MTKDVIISIKSHQSYDWGGEDDAIELVTEGRLVSRGKGNYLLSYMESALTGMEGTRTTLRVDPNRVSLIRTGTRHFQLTFERGKKNTGIYQTPLGPLEVGVSTRSMNVGLTENGGELVVDYAMEIGHMPTGHSLLSVRVREPEQAVLSS